MHLSERTTLILTQIEQLARRLTCKEEIGMLIELAHQHNKLQTLDDLSFFSKFCSKTFGIMQRIGNEADGYDKLAHEFSDNLEKSKKLVNELLSPAPGDVKNDFENKFFDLSPSAFQNYLSLIRDLSWYKNYLIDSRQS